MEVDIEQWVLKAAMLKMSDQHHTHESFFIWKVFEEMYPEADILARVRQQVREYQKLTEG